MTDQTIPAGLTRDQAQAVREWAERSYAAEVQDETMYHAARVLLAVLPKRPTLADMTNEERLNAVGMWADVDGFHPYRAVVGDIPAPKVPVFRPTAGSLDWVHPEDVTPLPELGRAWIPGGSPIGTPAPAPDLPEGWRLADHEDHGRVIVTTTPTRDGRVYYVLPSAAPLGYDWLFCHPDELTYIDTGLEADQ